MAAEVEIMKRLLLLFPLLSFFTPLAAHEIKSGNLTIIHPMVAEAAKGQATAKGSVTIRNDGKSTDQLLSISAEFADKVTIGAPSPVPVPASGETVIPLTFENIKRKLLEDEAYSGELVFEKAGTVEIDLMIHNHPH
jgi:copper(I)-binding protein